MELLVAILGSVASLCGTLFVLAFSALVPLCFVALFALIIQQAYESRRQERKKLLAVAAELGFEVEEGQFPTGIFGTVDGHPVTAQRRIVGTGKQRRVVYTVTVRGLEPTLNVSAEGLLTSVFYGADFKTADGPFDDAFRLDGDEVMLAALLGDAERGALRALAQNRTSVGVDNGQITASRSSWGDLATRIRNQVAIAKRLAPTDRAALRDRLAHNAVASIQAPVRLVALRLLAVNYRGAAEVRGALETACADPSPKARYFGARGLGDDGAPTLLALIEDAGVPSEIRTEAAALWGVLPVVAEERVAKLLMSDCEDVVLAAIRALGARGTSAALPELLALCPSLHPARWTEASATRQAAKERAATLAAALGSLGDAAAEPALLALLGWDDDPIQEAAATALGKVGSLAAVEHLLPLAEGRFERESVKQAARGAITALQAGMDRGVFGAVSLATPADEAGAVSLASDERLPAEGAVSLADKPRRSLLKPTKQG